MNFILIVNNFYLDSQVGGNQGNNQGGNNQGGNNEGSDQNKNN